MHGDMAEEIGTAHHSNGAAPPLTEGERMDLRRCAVELALELDSSKHDAESLIEEAGRIENYLLKGAAA